VTVSGTISGYSGRAAGGAGCGPGDGEQEGGAGWRKPWPLRRRLLQAGAALLAAASAGTTGPGGWTGLARAAPPTLGRSRNRPLKWLVFYGQTADEAVLSDYDLVVLDPMFQGDLARVGADGTTLCAYLSLGEIRQTDPFFGHLDAACLLEENRSWPGTWRLDVRQAAWKALVLHEVLPAIMAQGFTGLMLDTLDTPSWLEQIDPVANRGMRAAAIELVRAIRRFSPTMPIIVNRGYGMLPDIVRLIDGVLVESLLTTPGPDGCGFRWNSPDDVLAQLVLLAPARERKPSLPVLSLDYWDPADAAGVREIYRRQRALGHLPYVATPLLNEIRPEPAE
jgi:polysaccharide biosynthesis protein PelA